jgi:hypothetical protein
MDTKLWEHGDVARGVIAVLGAVQHAEGGI